MEQSNTKLKILSKIIADALKKKKWDSASQVSDLTNEQLKILKYCLHGENKQLRKLSAFCILRLAACSLKHFRTLVGARLFLTWENYYAVGIRTNLKLVKESEVQERIKKAEEMIDSILNYSAEKPVLFFMKRLKRLKKNVDSDREEEYKVKMNKVHCLTLTEIKISLDKNYMDRLPDPKRFIIWCDTSAKANLGLNGAHTLGNNFVTYSDSEDENVLPHQRGKERQEKQDGQNPVPVLSKMMRKNTFILEQKHGRKKKTSYTSIGSYTHLGSFGLTPQSRSSWKDDQSDKSSSKNSKNSPTIKQRRKSKGYASSKFKSLNSKPNLEEKDNSIKRKATKVYNKYAKLAQESRSYLSKSKMMNQKTRYKSTEPQAKNGSTQKPSYFISGTQLESIQETQKDDKKRNAVKRNTYLNGKKSSTIIMGQDRDRLRSSKIRSPFNGADKMNKSSQNWSNGLRSSPKNEAEFSFKGENSPSKFSSNTRISRKSRASISTPQNLRLTPMNQNKASFVRKSRSPIKRVTKKKRSNLHPVTGNSEKQLSPTRKTKVQINSNPINITKSPKRVRGRSRRRKSKIRTENFRISNSIEHTKLRPGSRERSHTLISRSGLRKHSKSPVNISNPISPFQGMGGLKKSSLMKDSVLTSDSDLLKAVINREKKNKRRDSLAFKLQDFQKQQVEEEKEKRSIFQKMSKKKRTGMGTLLEEDLF